MIEILQIAITNPFTTIITMGIGATLFILIGHKYPQKIQSVLKKPIIIIKENTIDYWSVTHYILYGTFGFLVPNHAFEFFILGGCFELFEDYMSSKKNRQYLSQVGDIDNNNEIEEKNYWYSNPSDWWINLIGYATGEFIRHSIYVI